MIELLQLLKSYWWLVLGVCGFIVWLINTILAYLKYRQEGHEYLDRQRNRHYWRWLGCGIGVAVLIQLIPEPEEPTKVPESTGNTVPDIEDNNESEI